MRMHGAPDAPEPMQAACLGSNRPVGGSGLIAHEGATFSCHTVRHEHPVHPYRSCVTLT